MAEYIKREALIKYIEEDLALCDNALSENAPITYGCKLGLRAALGYAQAMAAADVVEVRHGEWVEWEDEMLGVVYMCSVCKEDFVTEVGTPSDNLWNYCPYCGAKMDGKGEGE